MIKHRHIEVCVFFSMTVHCDLLNENIYLALSIIFYVLLIIVCSLHISFSF